MADIEEGKEREWEGVTLRSYQTHSSTTYVVCFLAEAEGPGRPEEGWKYSISLLLAKGPRP
ncbi:uncharacterized protein RSE6_01946 [Rhynchosporium secalis]|uniref:Uncharacterized protein n=1 Tax=Rhynchosporium secalis TaxID=38038 RepID=A0A1E1LZ18_RHYSE|nr:uncharacterized protein RSE6_01946 [Rhynchosporium secalis]